MGTAYIIHPVIPHASCTQKPVIRPDEETLDEICGLTEAIDLRILATETVRIVTPRPATLFGTGRLEQIRSRLEDFAAPPDIVIIDGILSPVQHRNLEKAWHVKVLDRTALILEIFGARAQTKEGKLQVALAHLSYQRSRLVRSWTHLERQRGGAGFLGGPGERQIESDRRILAHKILKLKDQIEQVRRTRNLQRAQRKKAPYPVIALVGYTNAGKSTLFNYLTSADVLAKDMLFATLDPTMRALDLPSRTRIILSDTVGFISDLPTQLVAAFRATLEEVNEADIILHVRDISHPSTEAQRTDVLSVLRALGIKDSDTRPVIEVWNKADLLGEETGHSLQSASLAHRSTRQGTMADPIPVLASALSGDGVRDLCSLIDEKISQNYRVYKTEIPQGDGRTWAWLHQHGAICADEDNGAELQDNPSGTGVSFFRLSEKSAGQYRKLFAYPLIDMTDP